MKIIVSNIPVVDHNDTDREKVHIMDSILENIKPLFDEIRPEKEEEIKAIKSNIEDINKKRQQLKNIISKLSNEYEIELVKQKLLQRISKLIKSGIALDTQIKKEILIILKVIPKMTKQQLEQNSRKILDIFNNKINK